MLQQVRLSVRSMPVLCLNECTHRHTFWRVVGASLWFFQPTAFLYNSKGNPSAGGTKYTGWGNFAIIAIYLENSTR